MIPGSKDKCAGSRHSNTTIHLNELTRDTSTGLWLLVPLICFTTLIFVLCFKTNYRQIETEKAIIEASYCSIHTTPDVSSTSQVTLPFGSVNVDPLEGWRGQSPWQWTNGVSCWQLIQSILHNAVTLYTTQRNDSKLVSGVPTPNPPTSWS